MSEKIPTVSVIIPTYNRAHLVGRAIRSVLNQTFQDFEIIVVDDGSTDNTEEVVKSFNDPRIRDIRHEQNRGGSAARNTGIGMSGYNLLGRKKCQRLFVLIEAIDRLRDGVLWKE